MGILTCVHERACMQVCVEGQKSLWVQKHGSQICDIFQYSKPTIEPSKKRKRKMVKHQPGISLWLG